jgi:hypothetical protein
LDLCDINMSISGLLQTTYTTNRTMVCGKFHLDVRNEFAFDRTAGMAAKTHRSSNAQMHGWIDQLHTRADNLSSSSRTSVFVGPLPTCTLASFALAGQTTTWGYLGSH